MKKTCQNCSHSFERYFTEFNKGHYCEYAKTRVTSTNENLECFKKSVNLLAADTINGVYVSEHPGDAAILLDEDFYRALEDDFEGTIYGTVSDELAKTIENEYGIH